MAEILGLKELNRKMSRLDSEMKKRLARAAVSEAGNELKKRAQANAPSRTGTTRAAVTKRVRSKTANEYYYVTITVKDSPKRPDGQSPERYYRFLELGTKYHAARPWLGPTLEENKEEMTRIIAGLLDIGIQTLAR